MADPCLVAHATVKITQCGHFQLTTEDGVKSKVVLEPRARLNNAGTSVVAICNPHISLPPPPEKSEQPVTPQMTLFDGDAFDAALWLLSSEPSTPPPCVLDFASDSEPGGGWKGRQRGTQEEDLCRRSNLGVCLEEHYQRVGAASYMPSLSAVYIPDVLVFRGAKDYHLLPVPFWTSVIAAALRCTRSDAEIRSKIDGVLRIAGNHGHRRLVLGAWGCGAFGNDPDQIATHMAAAVHEYATWFDRVVFAIPSGKNFLAFCIAFPGCEVVTKVSMQTSPVDTTVIMHLTDQHKWELLTTLPDVVADSVAWAAVDPICYSSQDGLLKAADALLSALKASCLDVLAGTFPAPLLERLRVILPPHDSFGAKVSTDLLSAESDICCSFQESSRQLVTEIVREQRRSLNLARRKPA